MRCTSSPGPRQLRTLSNRVCARHHNRFIVEYAASALLTDAGFMGGVCVAYMQQSIFVITFYRSAVIRVPPLWRHNADQRSSVGYEFVVCKAPVTPVRPKPRQQTCRILARNLQLKSHAVSVFYIYVWHVRLDHERNTAKYKIFSTIERNPHLWSFVDLKNSAETNGSIGNRRW